MDCFRRVVLGGFVLLTALSAPVVAWAAPTPQQAAKLREADAALRKGGAFFKNGKFPEAAEHIKAAQAIVAELQRDPDAKKMAANLDQITTRLKNAHALMELEGIKLPPLEAAPAADGTTPAPGPVGGGLSFVKDVGPILMAKCGRCHITDNKGDFQMDTFAALEKGTADGVVVMPGKGSGSRLVEVIESGDMPRGGAKVSAEELAKLVKWIDEGAKFDGESKTIALAAILPNPGMPEQPRLEVAQATGKETVSFAQDIAPVLAENCMGCHGGRQPRARLGMDNFASLLRGGESGAPLEPGKPADSLLIKKLKGTAGAQMPLQRPALPAEVIAKFETWIAEGAKFDGPNAQQPLAEVIAYVFASRATHEELSARREKMADEKWRLAIPDDEASQVSTKNFLVVGNVSENRLKEIGDIAEAQASLLAKTFRVPADKPLIKGRMTIYAFSQRFDYSEFGKMVERRTPPDEWVGHWGYSVVDAYAPIHPPRDEVDYSLEALVAQQVAGTYVATLGPSVPQWFAEGTGRAMAGRLAAKDPRVAAWDERLPSAMASAGKPDAFMTGSVPPEDSAVMAYSYVKFLMGKSSNFAGLLQNLRKGATFDQAVAQAYGGTPQQLTVPWAGQALSRRRR